MRHGGKTGQTNATGPGGQRKALGRRQRHPDPGKGSRATTRRDMRQPICIHTGISKRRPRQFRDQRGMPMTRGMAVLGLTPVGTQDRSRRLISACFQRQNGEFGRFVGHRTHRQQHQKKEPDMHLALVPSCLAQYDRAIINQRPVTRCLGIPL